MKKTLTVLFLLFSISAFGKIDPTEEIKEHNHSEFSKEVTVNGMVCAFCSNSLEKKFKKEKAVEKINVDLDKKKVSVKFKKGKSLPDKELNRIIASSGFTVVDIKDPNRKKDLGKAKKDGQK